MNIPKIECKKLFVIGELSSENGGAKFEDKYDRHVLCRRNHLSHIKNKLFNKVGNILIYIYIYIFVNSNKKCDHVGSAKGPECKFSKSSKFCMTRNFLSRCFMMNYLPGNKS